MVAVKEFVKLRFIEAGEVISEISSGDDLYVTKNNWMNKNRVIDKKNDLYREIITDPQTGEIIHQCKEPLSLHRGHGSAKHKPKP